MVQEISGRTPQTELEGSLTPMTGLDIKALMALGKKGAAAQQAVDTLLAQALKCPHCGKSFLPQSWNARFCTYRCRNRHYYRELKRKTK
jgi:hypothetical protein